MGSVARFGAHLALGTALALAAACSSPPPTVLDGDLPALPGLESVYARNLERRDGALVGGRIVFRGRIDDPSRTLDRAIALYAASGWTVLERDASSFSGVAVLGRGDRRCTISVRSNRIDPAMSQAQIVLGPATPAEPPPS